MSTDEIKPATDEQVEKWEAEAVRHGFHPHCTEMLSLIARIRQDGERLAELEELNGRQGEDLALSHETIAQQAALIARLEYEKVASKESLGHVIDRYA